MTPAKVRFGPGSWSSSATVVLTRSGRRRQTEDAVDEIASEQLNPEQRAELAERDDALQKALQALAPEQRQIVVLRDYLDLSYAEIADVAGHCSRHRDVAPAQGPTETERGNILNIMTETAHVGELLSGYLDGELTQQQRQRVEVHCAACRQCREDLDSLEEMRTRIGKSKLSLVDQDVWRENMSDPTVQVSRGIGWLLLIGAGLILAGIVVVQFLLEPSISGFMKFLISAFYLGLAGLLISVIRQRADRAKNGQV